MPTNNAFAILLLFASLLFACGPQPQPAPVDPAPQMTAAPQATAALPTAEPSATTPPTVTPTATPDFPLGYSDPLPQMQPITIKNAGQIIPVAGMASAQIYGAFLASEGEKLIFVTSAGVETIDTANFTSSAYQPRSAMALEREVSPNGRVIAELLPGLPKFLELQVTISDLTTGKTRCTFKPFSGSNVRKMTFYGNNSLSLVIGGSQNYRVVRWDVNACKISFDAATRSPVYAISQDGMRAALGENDKLFLYTTDIYSKTSLGQFTKLRGAYFLPDGKTMLVSTSSSHMIYDIASKEKIAEIPGKLSNSFARYQLSNDGQWVLISAYQHNALLRLADYQIYNLPIESVSLGDNPLVQSSDILQNGLLVTNDFIWNIEKQARTASLKKYGTWMYEKHILISADGLNAAASPVSQPHYIDIIDLTSGKVTMTIPGYHHPLALPDRSGFIATNQGKTAFFTYTSDQPTKILDLHYTNGLSLADGTLVVWDDYGNVSQLDISGQSVMRSTRLSFLLPEAPIQHLAPAWQQGRDYNFDGFLASFMPWRWNKWVVSNNRQFGIRESQKDTVQLFRLTDENAALQSVRPEDVLATYIPGPVYEMTFSRDDRYAAGVFRGQILIWETATGKQAQAIKLPSPPGFIFDFDFTPDGSKILLSSGEDTREGSYAIHTSTTLRVFEVASGRLLQQYRMEQKYQKSGCNITLPFVVTADSTQVFTISPNCQIGLFDLKTWEMTHELGERMLNANIKLALSPDDSLLAVAYKERLELWNVATGTMIKRESNPAHAIYPRFRDADFSYIYQVAFSPDGSLLGARFGWNYPTNSVITLWGVP